MAVLAFLLLAFGIGILCHRAFVYGYNAGWDERQRDMTISATRLNKSPVHGHDGNWHSFVPKEGTP